MSGSFGTRIAGPGSATRMPAPQSSRSPSGDSIRSETPTFRKVLRGNAEPVVLLRFVAGSIDYLIWLLILLMTIIFVFGSMTGFEGLEEAEQLSDLPSSSMFALGLTVVLAFLVCLTYGTLMEWLFGATIGKFLTGTRVMTTDGQAISLSRALARNTIKFVSASLPILMAYWTMLFTEEKQTLHDLVGGTSVYRSSDVLSQPHGHDQKPMSTKSWARSTVKSYAY